MVYLVSRTHTHKTFPTWTTDLRVDFHPSRKHKTNLKSIVPLTCSKPTYVAHKKHTFPSNLNPNRSSLIKSPSFKLKSWVQLPWENPWRELTALTSPGSASRPPSALWTWTLSSSSSPSCIPLKSGTKSFTRIWSGTSENSILKTSMMKQIT